MKKFFWIYFICIIVFAIALRFWQLGQIPAGFHSDEAAFGYNAYSLLKTGKDEYGKPFPLILKSFSDYKAAVYSYLTIPFIAVRGLNEWSVRAPSAVLGIIFVLLTYALVYQLSKDRMLAIVAMALAAISPLGIELSRVQSDPLVCITFFYAVLYFWFLFEEKRQARYMFLSIFMLILSFYTNTVTRIFAVPFFFLIGYWYWPRFDKQLRTIFAALCIGVLILVAVLYMSPAGERFTQVTVFSKMDVQLPLDEELREDGQGYLPLVVTRMVHNKVTAYGRFLIKNYTDYLGFPFLFLQALQPNREQIPNMGVLLIVELPFLLMGIYTAIRRHLRYGLLSIVWFLLVPAVLCIASDETPNIHRFFLAMIPIHTLVALGIISGIRMVRSRYRRIVTGIIVLIFLANVAYFLHQLMVHQPVHNPIYRNAVDKELALDLKNRYASYEVIVSQKILEQILFFWPVDPAMYQKRGSPRDYDNAWYDKLFFVTDACPSNLASPAVRAIRAKRILYIDKAECTMEPGDTVVGTIRYGNTLAAYYLVEK